MTAAVIIEARLKKSKAKENRLVYTRLSNYEALVFIEVGKNQQISKN